MNEKLAAFFKAIIKYGGGNLVILLLSAWFFDSFFNVDPNTIALILNYLLWILFFETIFVLIVSRIFWVLDKARDFKSGINVSEEINGKNIVTASKEVGIDVLTGLFNVTKELIVKTPEEKEKKDIEKQINLIEKEIIKLNAD